MFRIGKSFRFEAAHQLLPGTLSKECSDCIHGHSYKVEIVVATEALDGHRMVIDFAWLKPVIQKICEEWDHALLLPRELGKKFQTLASRFGEIHLNKVVIMDENPTAESMALCIANRVIRELEIGDGVWVERVRVWETETGWAEWEVER